MAARLRVYKRGASGAEPDYWLPTVYGGRFDRLRGGYIEGDAEPVELRCHAGQVDLLTCSAPGVRRILALGAQGGGKTEAIVLRALLNGLELPNGISGVVAPTRDRLKVVWRKLLNLIQPANWVESVRPSDNEIKLRNGHLFQFVAAKRQSESIGSPIAGRDWQRAVEDEQQNIDEESLMEVDARGRIAADYRVYSTATIERQAAFQLRVQTYRSSTRHKVISFRGEENVFTPMEHWEALRAIWSKDDYDRKILCLDVHDAGLVYSAWNLAENVRPRPDRRLDPGADITANICEAKWGFPYEWVIGQDFGRRITTSVVLKAYRAGTDTIWYALDELTSDDGVTADHHARRLIAHMQTTWGVQRNAVIIIADPHVTSTTRDADKSDYRLFEREGLKVKPAWHERISHRHRFSMVNALLHGADGRRRLFVDCDPVWRGQVRARRLIDSLSSLRYTATGAVEDFGKDPTKDLTHWSDALGYALFPFERIRGSSTVGELIQPKTQAK